MNKKLSAITLLSIYLLTGTAAQAFTVHVKNKVEVWEDVQIANKTTSFPHKMDIIMPKDWKANTAGLRAIVALHGGGGTKHQYAYSLGIKTANEPGYAAAGAVNEDFIVNNQIVMVFVQGPTPYPKLKPKTTGWSNSMMDSKEDDLRMLQLLAAAIRQEGIAKVYLTGHSMGGVMTNKIWCESPSTFNAYLSSAGPVSLALTSGQTSSPLPCQPKGGLVRPHMHIAHMADEVIGLKGHYADKVTYLDQKARILAEPLWIVDPVAFANELHLTPLRAQQFCGSSAKSVRIVNVNGAPTGTVDSFCGGKIRIRRISGADHCIRNHDSASTEICAERILPGTTYLSEIVSFFKAN